MLGARSSPECNRRLARAQVDEGTTYMPVIDASAEGFAYYPQQHVISALAVKKRWNKPEIIALYHARKSHEAPKYSTKSLGNKRLEQVIAEIAELIR
ncbi:MAG: hypothetical protein HYY46_16250 [Deltaproteobacteria bacterium]|nr:hypothetical protein [Deltaproteobacteria bacterium]